MKYFQMKIKLVLMGLALVSTLMSAPIIAAPNNNPGIAPLKSKPHGHSYYEWAARWWQWALEQPATNHPVLDETGDFCSNGQKGVVWFLAGDFGGPLPIERTCTVPAGQALFFPVIDAYYGAFLNDPPETRTPEFLRSTVDCSISSAQVEIDGILVNNPQQYFLTPEKSLLFDVQLPIDNVFGVDDTVVPELLLSPSVDSGIFLFLSPLPVGEHRLHWEAAQSCPFGNFTQNVTYTLNVQPHNGNTFSNVLRRDASTNGIHAP